MLSTFKELAPALRELLEEGAFRRLEAAVAALDFKSALAALNALGEQSETRAAQ